MDVENFYSRVSSHYYSETFQDTSTLSAIMRRDRTRRVLAMLEQYLQGPSTVADIGCGPAQFAIPLMDRGHTYLGIDICPEMYREMESRLAGKPRVRFQTGSADNIPLPDNSVDAIICIGVIEYINENKAALTEVHRILKKSGVAIFTYPNLQYPIFLVRGAMRPVLAPILRILAPCLRGTVYVSGITHRNLSPYRFARESIHYGFRIRAQCSHGYYPIIFNFHLSSQALYERMERWGQRCFPHMGANYITCLEKTG